jgi:hypothetical protein
MREAACLLLVLLPLHGGEAAHEVWFWEGLAQEAEVLVAGKVLEVTATGEPEPDGIPIGPFPQPMSAKIEVLRWFAPAGEVRLEAGEVLAVTYRGADPEQGPALGPRRYLPRVAPNETWVFPLLGIAPHERGAWELLDEENRGLLVPCSEEGIAEVEPDTGLGFIQAELAGVYLHGDYARIHGLSDYFATMFFAAEENVGGVCELLGEHVGEDEARWLTIATATYCSMGQPRARIAELREGSDMGRAFQTRHAIAACALQHLPAEGLEDRIITEAMAHCEINAMGAGITLAENYPRHPTTLKLLGEVLEQDSPTALVVAGLVVKDAEHPLLATALSAAMRELGEPERGHSQDLGAACRFVRDYGDEEQFQFLLGEIERAQTEDRGRYTRLWSACLFFRTLGPRTVPLYSIFLSDAEVARKEEGLAYMTPMHLQQITGVDFGLAQEQTPEEREAAIEKARAWLRENAP